MFSGEGGLNDIIDVIDTIYTDRIDIDGNNGLTPLPRT